MSNEEARRPPGTLATLAALARTDDRALRQVVDHYPFTASDEPTDAEHDLEWRQSRQALIDALAGCVTGLIAIVGEMPHYATDNGWPAWYRAIKAVGILADIGEPAVAAVPALIRAMHADPRGLGEVAGVALGWIGGDEAIRELNLAWWIHDRKLRDACFRGLAVLGKRGHATLCRIASDPGEDLDSRCCAIRNLRQTGCPAQTVAAVALPLIVDDPSADVRAEAIEALERLDDQARETIVLPMIREIEISAAEYRRDNTMDIMSAEDLERLRVRLAPRARGRR